MLAGVVVSGRTVQTRVNALGAEVHVIDNRDGSYESGEEGWITECATHGNYCLHETRAVAVSFVSASDEWCAECWDVANPVAPVVVSEEPAPAKRRNGSKHVSVNEGPCEVTGPNVESKRVPVVGAAISFATFQAGNHDGPGTWYVREHDRIVYHVTRNVDRSIDVTPAVAA